MRILYLTSSLSPYDGYGRASRALIEGMCARGHDVVALAPGAAAEEAESRPLKGNATVHPVLGPPREYWQRKSAAIPGAWRVRTFARNADLVHCLVEPYWGVAGWGSGGRPLVLSVVGTYAIEPFVNRKRAPWGHARSLRRADCVAAISQYSLARLTAHLRPRRAEVIPLGVDDSLFQSVVARRPDPRPLILSVGAMKPRKGTLALIRAAALLAERVRDFEMHLVGDIGEDADYAEQCRRLINDSGLGSRVFLRGRLEDGEIDGLSRRAWCFALCPENVGQKFEGFGLVYVEAAARGLASVASRDCGAEEFVRHEDTGLLAPQGDPGAIAAALERMLSDEALRERLAQSAHRLAKTAFRWSCCIGRLEELYEGLSRSGSV